MSGNVKKKPATSKRRARMMDDRESAALLESASQALEMVRGPESLHLWAYGAPGLAGGRITVRQAPPQPRQRGKKDIVRLRKRLNFSQGMLARALDVSTSTVQAWEAGRRTPSDAALKLLAIAEKHPQVLLDSI